MQNARQAAPPQLQSTTAPNKDAMQQSAVRAALIRMHAATVLFGISGIFGKLCQCSAVVLSGQGRGCSGRPCCSCLVRRDRPGRESRHAT